MTFKVSDYDWPAYQGRKPFDHQKTTVAFELANMRGYVLNDMGTGKTLSAAWALDILIRAKKIRRALVVCPISSLEAVWFNEFRMNLPHLTVGVAHGTKQKRLAVIESAAYSVVVINHDGIKTVEDELIRQCFDVIVIDELTAFKSPSERTKCMKRICDRVRAVWGMTGDMTPNAPTEAFWQCQVVNPSNKWLPRYFGQFRDACMKQVNEMIWIPKPEAPQIVAMVAQPAIRFTREQCLDLPDTMFQTLEIALTAEQNQYYDRMKRDAYVDMESGQVSAVNAGVKLNKLLQISAGAVKNDEGQVIEIGAKPRLDQMVEIFEQTPQRKLVVFATYRATIEMILKHCEKVGIRAKPIHGDVNRSLRAQYIEQFQRGDLQLIVLQPQTAAHSITLVAASTMLWFSLVPSNELFNQGVARIVRAGQVLKTMVYMFVSTPAERRVAQVLQERGNLSQETLRIFEERAL